MKTIINKILFCFWFMTSFLAYAQDDYAQSRYDIPNVENPNLPNSHLFPYSFYQSLQSEYLIKTTKSFELNSDVKSIKETISSANQTENIFQTIKYDFLENGNLLSYEEDTLNSFKNSHSTIEKYTYDTTKNVLSKMVFYNGNLGANYITTIHFNSDGYIIKEKFNKFKTQNYEPKENVFDYVLTFEWNENRDTVKLNYNYKTERSSYQRHGNGLYSLVKDKQKLKENRDSVQTVKNDFVSTIFGGITAEYDSVGNLLKYYIYDNTIKNSNNIHQLFEYKYNQNKQLIEVKHSLSGPQPEFLLNYKYEIKYLKYDKNGNWSSKKIADYTYEREIVYY